jgi:hypothetical protein
MWETSNHSQVTCRVVRPGISLNYSLFPKTVSLTVELRHRVHNIALSADAVLLGLVSLRCVGERGRVVVQRAVLQAGRSRVQYPMR